MVRLDPKPASASVVGEILSAATNETPKYEAFLLMPDGSPEAWYPVNGGHFGFAGRSPGIVCCSSSPTVSGRGACP